MSGTIGSPAGARTVFFTDQPTMLRGRTIAVATPSWPQKDPVDIETYAGDFSAIIGTRKIVQPNIAITPSGILTVINGSVVGCSIVLTLAGGTDGATYTITLGALLDDGSLVVRAVQLPVVAQAAIALSPADPTTLSINGITVAVGGFAFTVGVTQAATVPFVPGFVINPLTGQPYIDPQTGQPIPLPGITPPTQSSATASQTAPSVYAINPATGQPYLDPRTGQPILMPSPGGATS